MLEQEIGALQNGIQVITQANFDIEKYMQDMGTKIRVLPPQAWGQELIQFVKNGDVVSGARLPWCKTHDNLRFREGEVTLWQGINGHGKSLLVGQAAMWFASQNQGVCIASFEMKPVRSMYRMLRQYAMNNTPSVQIILNYVNWAKGKIWFYDQQGSVRPNQVFAVIRYAAQELGIKHMVIDSLMKCVRGEDDYNGQKNFIDMLTTLAKDFNIHIHLVHHVRKGESEENPPNKFDSRGAASITDQVDQVLTVWRNKKKEKEIERAERLGEHPSEDLLNAPDALLICDKNRNGEWEGSISLWFHRPSFQYTPDRRNIPIDISKANSWLS